MLDDEVDERDIDEVFERDVMVEEMGEYMLIGVVQQFDVPLRDIEVDDDDKEEVVITMVVELDVKE